MIENIIFQGNYKFFDPSIDVSYKFDDSHSFYIESINSNLTIRNSNFGYNYGDTIKSFLFLKILSVLIQDTII